ncbi:PglZ domain-containing protein [bacterium]|nr:PglZ domain-containing protein [bacterium]
MSWQRTVYNRLKIRKNQKRIILDKTGVLLHESFLEYLETKEINFVISNSLQEILVMAGFNNFGILLSLYRELPTSLSNKIDVIVYDYGLMSIDIEYPLAQSLNTNDLISLLCFYNDSGKTNLITETNIQNELIASKRHQNQIVCANLKDKIFTLSQSTINYDEILEMGKLLGEYVYLCYEIKIDPDDMLLKTIDEKTENAVLNGCLKHSFHEFSNNLKTVDKIRSHIKQKNKSKIALICFDGMGVAEWKLLEKYLSALGFNFSEKYLFALIPTVTSISRSAIYYGTYESVYFLGSINEEKQFNDYFKNRFCRFYREGEIKNENSVLGVDIVSVIYNFFDELAHDTKLPPGEQTKTIYFKNVLSYLEKSRIKDELLLLKKLGYSIFFCSDHGSVVAQGNGQKIDKYLIEQSCKRATLMSKSELANSYDANQYEIPFITDKIALLAKGRTMFASKKETKISHGGITLDELIVPFVEILN